MRPPLLVLPALVAVALAAAGPAHGQSQAERPRVAPLPTDSLAPARAAAVDTAAVVLALAGRLETEGRTELAESLYALVAERWPGTAAGASAGARLAALRQGRLDRSGRVELLVWSTIYGLWLGFAVPAAFGADDTEPYGLGLLVGGPAGLLAGRRYAERNPVSDEQARAIAFGGVWGTWQGYGWREVLDLGDRETCFTGPDGRSCYDESSEEAAFTAMIVGGLAGIAAGAALARAQGRIDATATLIQFGGLWGTWYGAATGVLLDAEDDALLTALLVGGNAGLVTMALAAPEWSRGRTRLISIAGVAGLLGGLGLDLLIQPESEKVAIAIPAVTSVVGLLLGAGWTRDHDTGRGSRSEDDPGRGALLRVENGRAGLSLPVPRPALLAGPDRRPRPGVRLELASIRF